MSISTPMLKPTKTQKITIIYFLLIVIGMFLSLLLDNFLCVIIIFLLTILLNLASSIIGKRKAASKNISGLEIKKIRTLGVVVGTTIFLALFFGFLLGGLPGLLLNVVAVLGCWIATIIFNLKWNLDENAKPNVKTRSSRLRWVDEFRGLVVIFLIIAGWTWILSGDVEAGNLPIGPTYLNHGWKYVEIAGWPPLITIIDIGQQILMFVVGFVGALAYYCHKEKEGKVGAILHIFRRFFSLMAFSIIIYAVIGGEGLIISENQIVKVFFTDTFPNIAWGSLGGLLLVAVLEKKPDTRLFIALGIMGLYSILYAFPGVQNWTWEINGIEYFRVPWNTINHIAIAILGTCTYDWFQWLGTKEDPDKGWVKRILPVGTLMFIGAFLIDFLEPAEHHDATTGLVMLAIGTSQYFLYMFYAFDKIGFHIIALSDFGKNIMLMFLYTGVQILFFEVFPVDILYEYKILALLVAGVLPILYQYIIAWTLSKNKIYMKF